jgi:hypothetical protein
MIGDSIFGLGAVVLGWFVLGLVTGQSYDKQGYVLEGGWEVLPQEVPPLHVRGSPLVLSDYRRKQGGPLTTGLSGISINHPTGEGLRT